MSEAELHILKQRMNEGRLNKARRGELLFNLPLGYTRRPSGEIAFDPDEEAQAVVKLVFKKFDEIGTLNGVLKFLVRHGVKLPMRVARGVAKGELRWHRPNRGTIQNVLKNPMYAGAYVYGRRVVDPRRKVPGRPHSGLTVVPREEWQVFLKDRLPAYIPWEQYERNQGRLEANRSWSKSIGAVKHGPALLSGLLVCGRCGNRMTVSYTGTAGNYRYCCLVNSVTYGEAACQCVTGAVLDQFVAAEALKALEPASLELSFEVAQSIEQQREEIDRLWRRRLERARYESERAARQYNLVEPENRLVARNLEGEWEEKLAEQRRLEEEYERDLREQPRLLTREERHTIRRVAADIPALWESSETTAAERKEILRQVIDRVVVDIVGESERVKVRIDWAGGTQTQQEIVRPVARFEQLSYWPQLEARLRELVDDGLSAPAIAQRLNQEGLRPPKRSDSFTAHIVWGLTQRLGIRRQRTRIHDPVGSLRANEWWLRDLADDLGMRMATLRRWLRQGWATGRQVDDGRWVVWADASEVERLRELRKRPRYHYTPGRRPEAEDAPESGSTN